MSISLTPDVEAMIREKVESGRYGSASDLVREALQILEEHDREREAALRAELAIGIEQADRGETIELTREVFDRLVNSSHEAIRQGRPFKDAVVG